MKTILISKHIHSNCSSYSSNDVFLNVLTNSKEIDFNVKENEKITSSLFPFLNGETIVKVYGDRLFQLICLKADETFSHRALRERKPFGSGYENSLEFKELISKAITSGWKIIKDIPERTKFYERQDKRTENERKKEGYVLWQRYEDLEKEPITVYQGGFSDELFNNSYLQKYLSGGGVFGWIGNSSRKAYLDEAIESGLKSKNLGEDYIATWLTSNDGRHFADSLDGFEKEEQLEKIKENLNRIFNLALIYSSSFHEGTYKSTCEIRKDYEAQGILLPEDGNSYDAEGHFKLLEAFFKAMGIKKKGEE